MREYRSGEDFVIFFDHPTGKVGKVYFSTLGDEIIVKKNMDEVRLAIVNRDDNVIRAEKDDKFLEITLSDGKHFLFVESNLFDSFHAILVDKKLSRMVKIKDPYCGFVENRSWVEFVEDVLDQLIPDFISVKIMEKKITVSYDIGDWNEIKFTYDALKPGWQPVESEIETDWGVMKVRVKPDIESVNSFLSACSFE